MSRRTRGPSAAISGLAALLVPSYARDRYRAEFASELAELPASRRPGHALRLLVAAWPLRLAVLAAAAAHRGHPDPPLGCLLGLRHRWRVLRTSDGHPYRACRRCGLDDPHLARPVADGLAFGTISTWQ
ncbi:hypothetical protein H5V45_16385 [Nocardioides sp. KIGAM211]|uniref:Uncharacterized protein n=1 Tax=Nocardioides luti TaxID=2761101 RepID=A0A7X0RIQ9_9ACTN|nr:hypothetical protein [Nocardioides luti]MBB6628907.1 hypothetical protein [Nocardioides luti]